MSHRRHSLTLSMSQRGKLIEKNVKLHLFVISNVGANVSKENRLLLKNIMRDNDRQAVVYYTWWYYMHTCTNDAGKYM